MVRGAYMIRSLLEEVVSMLKVMNVQLTGFPLCIISTSVCLSKDCDRT